VEVSFCTESRFLCTLRSTKSTCEHLTRAEDVGCVGTLVSADHYEQVRQSIQNCPGRTLRMRLRKRRRLDRTSVVS
jgi:hypothetical protein